MTRVFLPACARRLAGCGLLTVLAAAPALAERSPWSPAEQSELRLLLAPGPAGETIAGGVEIALQPDWYTYWRNPGEAGVPPVFDFAASENVRAVEVLYPAPQRYDDGTSVSLIYRDEVVFPLEVTPIDRSLPVTLRVEATFGVCLDVCIPTRAAAEATVAPGSGPDALANARLDRFLRRVPGEPQPGRLDVEAVTLAEDALLIDLRVPDSAAADLYAEPPAGWYLGQPSLVARQDGRARYRLALAGRPRDAAVTGQTFRFVATAGDEAIEEIVTIR